VATNPSRQQVVRVTGSNAPDESQVAKYRQAYLLYRQLYPTLQPSFQKLS
jgi:hypothetical protein